MERNQVLASNLKDRQGYSTLQLFNPFSPLMGGGDRIPDWAMKIFPGSPTAAWLTAKSAAVGGTAALLAAAYRGLKHLNYTSDMAQEDDPDKNIAEQVGTTYSMDLTTQAGKRRKKRKGKEIKKVASIFGNNDVVQSSEVEMPRAENIPLNTLYTGVPIAAMILGAASMYKLVDTYAGKAHNKLISKKVQQKNNMMKELLQARARVAKGTITQEEMDDILQRADSLSPYVKTASKSLKDRVDEMKNGGSLWRTSLTSHGLLAAALMALTGAASYQYFKKADKNNIRYKAMKKGLEEYTKGKVMQAPINIIPASQTAFFSTIDNGVKQEEDTPEANTKNSARDDIEIHEPNKSISVTL